MATTVIARNARRTGPGGRISRLSWLLLLALLIGATPLARASEYAKGSIVFPGDPFAVPSGHAEPGWVKFTILVDDPENVVYQDSNFYPYHYNFAVNELPPFAGMTPEQFDQVTLYEEGQMANLGAVILPPLVGYEHVFAEYGIQLVRQDPYAPAEVVALFNLVKSTVLAEPNVQAFYFPTYEQRASAEENREYFESQGIVVSSPARWATGNTCYSNGWALGPLKYFEGSQIEAAYLNGDLEPGDVLLTDELPAEIPFVAGVITMAPTTPASHVVILAGTFNVPMTHLVLDGDVQSAQDLVGHKMVLRVEDRWGRCQVRLIDVEGVLDQAVIDEILLLKLPPELEIDAIEAYGAYSTSTDILYPSDIRFFGGKAANFGLLRRTIPQNSPVAAAFSFDLWNGFMDRPLAGGTTLRQVVAGQLAGYTYPPDMQALSATLDGIRDLIKDDDETFFPPAAETAILDTLQDPRYGFNPIENLRFRSSTNVEDGDRFSGAGLYDSYSGCLADDLDSGNGGPSHCDPEEPSERGVFRAIRKVFASFYNFNAFLERLRHGIDENQVGMAILVHHSFPDDDEMANGVALQESFSTHDDIDMITQLGASSVTNPEPGAIPEEVYTWVYHSTGGAYPTVLAYSNLVVLGETVMDFPHDYKLLANLLVPVADAYEAATGATGVTLEYEFKKMAPGDIIVKQVRRVPQADDTPSITPFLINEPVAYCLFQGEAGDVFANHRLKSRWSFETRSMWLTEENLQDSFFADTTLEYVEACQVYEQSGQLPQWPQATHTFDAGTALDGWRLGTLQNPRNYTLTTRYIPTLVAPSESPLVVLSDFGGGCLWLAVVYDEPVPSVDWFQNPIMTLSDSGYICPCPVEQVGDLLQQRVLAHPSGVTIDTTFYWPPDPLADAGYTAPLVRWVETVIHGLTSTPVVLQGEYSQTYRPEHHNFSENFIFDPAQEPGIPQTQLDELAAAGVRFIHAFSDYPEPEMWIYDEQMSGDSCLACSGFDSDHDGYCTGEPTFDCDDTRGDVWAVPGEVPDVGFFDRDTIAWSEPLELGGTTVFYDTIRSADAADFVTEGTCVESDDGPDREADDPTEPAAGTVLHYLVRAQNDCPDGEGPLGQTSEGTDRQALPCP